MTDSRTELGQVIVGRRVMARSFERARDALLAASKQLNISPGDQTTLDPEIQQALDNALNTTLANVDIRPFMDLDRLLRQRTRMACLTAEERPMVTNIVEWFWANVPDLGIFRRPNV